MAADRDYGLIIAAIVAIVAIVGLVIMFSQGGGKGTGLQIGLSNIDNICYFDPSQGGLVCPAQTEKVHQIFNRKDAGQVPFVPGYLGGIQSGTFGPSGKWEDADLVCGWFTPCPNNPTQTACQVCIPK